MSIEIENTISQLVESQFPAFYKEEGQLFILFVKAYYEWLETQEWYSEKLEQTIQNVADVTHHARQLTDYRDIDKTLDDFIIDFKNKYLPNIQFNTATNKRLFIKNALDFYRSKGSSRAVDLFFKLVYGLEARVYNPSNDIFKLSDNTWEEKNYIEMIPSPKNVNFVGQQIFGVESQASAYCEKLVKVKKGSRLIDVLTLSNLNGTFRTKEDVFAVGDSDLGTSSARNTIVGSLSRFEILASTPGFEIGETVNVTDGDGKKAKAIVTEAESAVGVVLFSIDGEYTGWGYGPDAEVIGTDRILVANNLIFEDDHYFYQTDPFQQFQLAKQDLLTVRVETAGLSNTDFEDLELGMELTAHANDADPDSNVVFTGTIVELNPVDDTFVINYTKSDYADNANGYSITDDSRQIEGSELTILYANNSGNTIAIDLESNNTIDAIIDSSIAANVIATGNTFTIEYVGDTTPEAGDVLSQREPTAQQRFAKVVVANTFIITETNQKFVNVTRDVGFFRSNMPFYRESDDAYFTIDSISNVQIGMIQYDATISTGTPFKRLANTYSSNTDINSYIPGSSNNKSYSYSTEATFKGPESTRTDTVDFFSYESLNSDGNLLKIDALSLDTVISNTDTIDVGDESNSEFAFISENAGNTLAGIIDYNSTTLSEALSYTNTAIQVGAVDTIVTSNPGEGYGIDPMFILYDPRARHLERYDYYIKYEDEGDDNVQKSFQVGEKITVTGKNAKAKITYFDFENRIIHATRLYLSNEFDDANTANIEENNLFTEDDFRIGDTITGDVSAISAIIEIVDEMRMKPRSGMNARILSPARTGDGFATELSIIDSGFGYFGKRFSSSTNSYIPGEELLLQSATDSSKTISTYGFVEQHGIAPGTHTNRRSFLSADKYLHDNDFYQEYSYQVLTALPFSLYKNTLIEVLHLAGSKPFGGYVGTSEVSVGINATDSQSIFDIKQFGLFINQNQFFSNTVIENT